MVVYALSGRDQLVACPKVSFLKPQDTNEVTHMFQNDNKGTDGILNIEEKFDNIHLFWVNFVLSFSLFWNQQHFFVVLSSGNFSIRSQQ